MNCCSPCGSPNRITKAELDRVTDKIENVLTSDIGRQEFRDFLKQARLRDGEKCLKLYELIHRCIESKCMDSDQMNKVLWFVDRIDKFDFGTAEKLFLCQENGCQNWEQVMEAAELETIRLLEDSYNLFVTKSAKRRNS